MTRAPALALSLLVATAVAAPGQADLQAAATQTAQTLGGVLRGCPASFAAIGTPDKQCVGAADPVEAARLKLSAALPGDLYGVWRSRDGQRSVYNWLRTAGGYVYLRLQPDPEGRAQTLIYLDLPPAQAGAAPDGSAPPAPTGATAPAQETQIGGVTLTPAAPASTPDPAQPAAMQPAAQPTAAQAPAPATATPAASPPVPDLASMPFGRTLKVQDRRLSGPDVLAVQNRLIALMRPQRNGHGDGWYGPLTAEAVRAFQKASGLPVTGVVDRDTWNRLFAASTPGFDAPATP